MQLTNFEDLDEFVGLMVEAFQSVNEPYEEGKIRMLASRALAQEPGIFCEIALAPNGEMAAFGMAEIGEGLVAPGLTVREIATYVRPQYRGMGTFNDMYGELIKWATENNAQRIIVNVKDDLVNMAAKYGFVVHSNMVIKTL